MAAPVHRDRRLRHGVLRKGAVAVPAHRREVVVRQQARGRPAHHRAAQRQPAGRLPDPGRARARPGLRADVRLRQRQGRRGVLRRHAVAFQLPGQPGQGRSRVRSSRARRGWSSTKPAASTDARRHCRILSPIPPPRSPPCIKPLPSCRRRSLVLRRRRRAGRAADLQDRSRTTPTCSRAGTTSASPARSRTSARSTARSCTTPTTSGRVQRERDAAAVGPESLRAEVRRTPAQRGFLRRREVPDATFKSTKVEAAGDGKLKVTGDLTMRGVTKPVVLDVTLNKAGEGRDGQPKIGFDATTTIKRSDFGVGEVRRRTSATTVDDPHHHRSDWCRRPRDRRRKVEVAMIVERGRCRRRARRGRARLARQPPHVLVRPLPRPGVDGVRRRCA